MTDLRIFLHGDHKPDSAMAAVAALVKLPKGDTQVTVVVLFAGGSRMTAHAGRFQVTTSELGAIIASFGVTADIEESGPPSHLH